MHVSVLLQEVIAALDLRPGMFVVDGTVDGGGHAEAILERIGGTGAFLGLDWDPELLATCEARIGGHPNVILRHANYATLKEVLEEEGLPKADALLLDLGFSSEQLVREKGLSFSENQPLTMTYSPDETPMYALLQQMSEDELEEVIRELGEERYARKIAEAIYSRERRTPIVTTKELAEIIAAAVPGSYERGRLNPATRTFQALRIYANDELGNLRKAIADLKETVKPGGGVAIISFHSLEDRIVKHEFKKLEEEGVLEIVTKKPIEATEYEISNNSRARSAKLRVATML
jgi:16S rRNA (cytosine1402-N4)-methyltransferase